MPPVAMVKVPAPDQLSVPPLVTVVAVNAPLAPKVSDLLLLIVTELGALVTEAFTVTA